MRLVYTQQTSDYYTEAVSLRISAFFNSYPNALELINDKYENSAMHLICLTERDELIGTGRLHIEKRIGVISQMAIMRQYQRKGFGSQILSELILQCTASDVLAVELNARESAIEFYKNNYNFTMIGTKFLSDKTGIIHQKIILELDR